MADDRAIGYQMTVKDCYRFVSESGMHVIAILEETDPSQYDRFVGRWESETRRYPVVEKRPIVHAHADRARCFFSLELYICKSRCGDENAGRQE